MLSLGQKGFGRGRPCSTVPDDPPKRKGLLDAMDELERKRKEKKQKEKDAKDQNDLDLGRIG